MGCAGAAYNSNLQGLQDLHIGRYDSDGVMHTVMEASTSFAGHGKSVLLFVLLTAMTLTDKGLLAMAAGCICSLPDDMF